MQWPQPPSERLHMEAGLIEPEHSVLQEGRELIGNEITHHTLAQRSDSHRPGAEQRDSASGGSI